jgi:hypothetical protein
MGLSVWEPRRLSLGVLFAWTSSFGLCYQFPQYAIDHAPLVWLHSEEPYMPSDIGRHVLETAPRINFEPITDALPLLNLDNLSVLNKYGKDGKNVFLTAVDDISKYPKWIFGEVPDESGALQNSTACVVVAVEHDLPSKQHIVDVFYFYFYSWNEGGDITQVLPPLNQLFPDSKPGDHFGNHLGDWEHNMIRFVNGKPIGIYFSHHTSGESCDWDDTKCLSKRGKRPLDFSARGSHANYPSAGDHVHDEALIDIADEGRLWDPVTLAYFYGYDPTTKAFTAADPGTAPTDWLSFNGNWGDEKFRESDPRQHTVPYFGLPKFEGGPNGPKFKHLVRKGLIPDEKPKTPLMKTLVHWYMGWYGCCLKGVPPYAVLISLVIALILMILLCVFTVRLVRPRLKAYILKKRRAEIKQDTSDVQLRLLDPENPEADEDD